MRDPATDDPADTGSTISDGAHLDEIEIADPAAPPPPPPEETGIGQDGLLTRAAFAQMILGGMAFAGAMGELACLRDAPARPTAGPACDALYDTCREVPALRWLLAPGGKWMQRAVAIGAFALPLGKELAGEIAARNGARSSTAATVEGAPSPGPAREDSDAMPPRAKPEQAASPMPEAA